MSPSPSQQASTPTAPTSSSPQGSPSSGSVRSALRGQDLGVQMSMLSPKSPVQRKGGEDTAGVHEAAAQGIASGGGTIPHAAAIQQAFGGHDVSGIQAHTGGAAAQASDAMGAEAYASGNHVAFKEAPDLHTAAHEAAHVVQQQQGVSLAGGVGQVGDSYEKHADAVADKVVAGESAEALLGGGSSGGESAVQKRASRSVQRLSIVQRDATTDPVPARPTTDEHYRAVPDYGTFRTRLVTDLGRGESEALGLWKRAVDGIQVAQDKWTELGGNWGAMTAWVDTAGRAPFEALGQELLPTDFPAPGVKYNLWSGGDPAQHYAASKGTILETSPCGVMFNRLKVTDESRWGINQAIWRGLSRAYALRMPVLSEGIDVYQRKQGDIFGQIEAPAVQEQATASGVSVNFNYVALTATGRFGKDSARDGAQSNEAWQGRLTAAAGGDEVKARAKAPMIFTPVTAGDLIEAGVYKNDAGGWAAKVAEHDAAVLADLTTKETELIAEAAAGGGGAGGTL